MKKAALVSFVIASLMCSGCGHQSRPVADKDPPVVTERTPVPVTQVVASAQKEQTLKVAVPPGPAQPEWEVPAYRPDLPPDRVSRQSTSKPQLSLEEADYPRGKKKSRHSGRFYPINYPTVSYRVNQPVSNSVSYRVQRPSPQVPNYPTHNYNRRGIQPAQQPVRNRPSNPTYSPRRSQPCPQPAVARPNYPTAGDYGEWERKRRALKQEYLQARADALNIKYNRGKPRFDVYSPAVQMSANAPPMVRPMARAPWDKLGHAFDRSEQKRRELRAFEQGRFNGGAHVPGVPQPGYHPSVRRY